MSSALPPESNPQLVATIGEAIAAAGGRITFRDYMELALYHPIHGYYSSPGVKTGKRGDYLTSPDLTPLFGRCLSRYLRSQGVSRVVEIGAGSGSLTAELADTFECTIIERSASLRAIQRERLKDVVTWTDEVPDGFDGAVISNELFDALPVHRVSGGREQYVRADLTTELGRYSPEVEEYFGTLGLYPSGEAEVNVDGAALMGSICGRLQRGLVLSIDYGYEAKALFVDRPQGTFMTYRGHTSGADAFEAIGYTDMTTHVDFTTLRQTGESRGLTTLQFTKQADFLAQNGIGELLVESQAELAPQDYYATRQAVVELLNPTGLGGFGVLIQARS
jgi:SAM-dependent MidA family methyltransferase